MTNIVVTVATDDATEEQVNSVVRLLQRATQIERVRTGFLVGPIGHAATRLAINRIGKVLTVAVRPEHGEAGLLEAVAIAKALNQNLVGADGQVVPANLDTVKALVGAALSGDGRDLAEKLGLILPRIKSARISVPF